MRRGGALASRILEVLCLGDKMSSYSVKFLVLFSVSAGEKRSLHCGNHSWEPLWLPGLAGGTSPDW